MNNPQQAWSSLARLALLGINQTPEPVPQVPGFAHAAGDNGPREAQVLLTAGALALVRKAGFQLPVAAENAPLPAPAPAEALAPLGVLGRQQLPALLGGRYSSLLPEYLAQLARHGRRIPHPLLVALLDYARPHPALHAAVSGVLGERGRWLATLNPEWQLLPPAAATEPDEALWHTGTLPQRAQLLKALRGPDPDRARELLAAALPQEPAKNQALLLTALTESLSATDEPLLEQYLGSKSKEVRQSVLPLLACLPGSALAERLWQRAEPLVHLKSTLLSKKLLVTLPEAWDKAWLANGIEQKDSRFQGEKAAWLGQLLALIPPRRWAAHWGVTPAKALAMAASSEWAALLLTAWREAMLLHQDAAWVLAYAELQLTADPEKIPLLGAPEAAAVVGTEPLTALLLSALPRNPVLGSSATWGNWLLTMPGPWPAALTRQALQLVGNTLRAAGSGARYMLHYQLTELLRHLEQVVPPAQAELCATARQELSGAEMGLSGAFEQLVATLEFRRSLEQTLTEPPAPDF